MDKSTEIHAVIRSVSQSNNHYSTLCVKSSASSAEIMQKYRSLCMLIHPDKTGPLGIDSNTAMTKVNAAYVSIHFVSPCFLCCKGKLTHSQEILKDAERRAVYDRQIGIAGQWPGTHTSGNGQYNTGPGYAQSSNCYANYFNAPHAPQQSYTYSQQYLYTYLNNLASIFSNIHRNAYGNWSHSTPNTQRQETQQHGEYRHAQQRHTNAKQPETHSRETEKPREEPPPPTKATPNITPNRTTKRAPRTIPKRSETCIEISDDDDGEKESGESPSGSESDSNSDDGFVVSSEDECELIQRDIQEDHDSLDVRNILSDRTRRSTKSSGGANRKSIEEIRRKRRFMETGLSSSDDDESETEIPTRSRHNTPPPKPPARNIKKIGRRLSKRVL